MEVEEEGAEIDEDLFATVMGYLTIEPNARNEGKAAPKKEAGAASKMAGRSISLDDFVTTTFPLIDLEKQAEIAQVSIAQSLIIFFAVHESRPAEGLGISASQICSVGFEEALWLCSRMYHARKKLMI